VVGTDDEKWKVGVIWTGVVGWDESAVSDELEQ
jgi:hypothetical protein